jgi:hypothetical protein
MLSHHINRKQNASKIVIVFITLLVVNRNKRGDKMAYLIAFLACIFFAHSLPELRDPVFLF